jgi:elongator complex protein 4
MGFVRKGAIGATDPGTRPGLHGQTLISSGHADLDRILGGGLPLGTLTVLLEDNGPSQHHASLLRLFLAEGAARSQSILLATPHPLDPTNNNSFREYLPGIALPSSSSSSKDKQQQKEEEEEEEHTLRIAWQYKRYLTKNEPMQSAYASNTPSSPSTSSAKKSTSSNGGLRDWCHKFDLTKTFTNSKETPGEPSSSVLGRLESIVCDNIDGKQKMIAAVVNLVKSLNSTTTASKSTATATAVSPHDILYPKLPPLAAPHQVGRIGVLSLGSLDWGWGGYCTPQWSMMVLQTLLSLKSLVRDSRCSIVVTLPPAGHNDSTLAKIMHASDCVVAFETVSDDSGLVRLAPDSATVGGVMRVVKLHDQGTVTAVKPPVELYLVRNRRRRLAISAVEVDPDAEAGLLVGDGDEGGGGSGGKVAGMLCGGGGVGKASVLDF